MNHRTAQALFRKTVAGLTVSPVELDEAFAHAESCAICGPRFELAPSEPSSEGKDMAELPVEPDALFARVLTAAPESVARVRAAERLGTFQQLGPAALAGLVEAAAEDPDAIVRAAALAALDELDDAVTLPQRVIEAWSASPAQAAPYLAACLSRLSDPEALASPSVTRLVTEATGVEDELAVSGAAGVTGRLARDEGALWLRLNRLPGDFEKSELVVAVPGALAPGAPGIEWSGESPGLVRSEGPVAEGSLAVRLGDVLPRRSLPAKLFERLYVLDPRKRRV